MSPDEPDDLPDTLADLDLPPSGEVTRLRRAVGHRAWRDQPTVHLTYDRDADLLVARVADLPAHRERFLHDHLHVLLDGDDGDALLVELRLTGFEAARRSPAADRARELLGPTAWRRAAELALDGDGEAVVRPDAAECARLLEVWADASRRVPVLGLQVGAGEVYGVLVDERGKSVQEASVPLSAATVAGVVDAVADLVAVFPPVDVIGLQIGAPVDREAGVVHSYHHDGASMDEWHDVPLAGLVRDRVGRPVDLINDVDALAVLQRWSGLRDSEDRYGVLLVSEGIGGSFIRLGQVDFDLPMELGNFVIHAAGRPCRCGGRGCVESTAGTWEIVERIRDDLGYVSVMDLAAAAALADTTPDPAVRAVFLQAGEDLAVGIGSVQALMNLHAWVIYVPCELTGGGAAAASLRFGIEQFAASVSYDPYTHCALKFEEYTARDAARGAGQYALERHGLATPKWTGARR